MKETQTSRTWMHVNVHNKNVIITHSVDVIEEVVGESDHQNLTPRHGELSPVPAPPPHCYGHRVQGVIDLTEEAPGHVLLTLPQHTLIQGVTSNISLMKYFYKLCSERNVCCLFCTICSIIRTDIIDQEEFTS